jgi:hypothetical protein
VFIGAAKKSAKQELPRCVSFLDPHFAFATDDLDAADANFVPRRDVFHQHPAPPEFQNFFSLLWRYFRSAANIFSCGDWFEMIGIDTTPYSAEMVNLKAVWNRPYDQCVKIAMRVSATIKRAFILSAHKRVSGLFVNVPNPNPAWRSVSSIFQYEGVRQLVGVAIEVVSRLASFIPASLVSPSRNLRLLAATALAKSITHSSLLPSTNIALVGV